MDFLAIIPARYASTRFPGKPLALIGGKPMIRHVYERAAQVFGEDCFVATDDRRIADAVESFDGKYVMTAGHHPSGTDRCAEALESIGKLTGKRYDVVVNIQGDEPFVNKTHLEALASLFGDSKTEIGTLVRRFRDEEDVADTNSPKVVMSENGFALYFSRLPIPCVRDADRSVARYKHIGLYAYRAEVLRAITALPRGTLEAAESLEQLRWLENCYKIKVAEVGGETLAVDTPEDLERVNALYNNGL